jgi:hypothetical protein
MVEYFGAYAKDYTEKPEYAGLQTLAMVATKQKEGAYGTTINKDIYVNGENGNTILGYNMAALCPPFCGKKGALDDSEEIGISIIDRGDAGMMII